MDGICTKIIRPVKSGWKRITGQSDVPDTSLLGGYEGFLGFAWQAGGLEKLEDRIGIDCYRMVFSAVK